MNRREYEMTETDYAAILEASKPVPYMVFGGMGPTSPQERANAAWRALGERMGFDGMSVEPSDKGPRFFTAVPVCA